MAVMGSGDIVIGKDPFAQKSASANPERSAERSGDPISDGDGRHCGAMSQQCAHNDAVSTPQKFLHLVGYRDPKVHPSRR
jgi:hypothetical protein